MNTTRGLLGLGFIMAAVACGGGGSEKAGPQAPAPGAPADTAAPAPASAAAPSGPTAKDQAVAGGQLYGELCASCHGGSGEGKGKAPAVVGKTALPLDPPAGAQFRKEKFKTAGDVYAFVKAKMPPKNPGSLTDEQTAAILAFDLQANGVDLSGKPALDEKAYAGIVLHP